MLEKIDFLSLDTAAIIVYTNSAALQTMLKKRIKERFSIARNLTKYADSASTLKEVKNDTFTPPFGGGTWLVDIQADSITYESDYAKYQYKGMREDGSRVVKNYTTPGTGPYWDKRMVSAEIDDVVKEVQDYARR